MINLLRFSIAIPVTKSEYFEKTLQSALCQTFDCYEIVILNNARDIHTKKEIRNIVERNQNSKIKYHENVVQISIIKNWNKCLEISSGEYFNLLSDDDIIANEFLKRMDEKINDFPNVALFHCRTKVIDENDQTINFTPSCPEYEDCVEFVWHRLSGYRVHMLSDFISKTSELKKIKGFVDFPLAWGSDDATWFKLSQVNGVIYCQDTLFSYRNSRISLTNNFNFLVALDSTSLFSRWTDEFIDGLTADDSEILLKIEHLKIQAKKHFSKIKSTIFVKYYGTEANLWSIFRALKSWLRYRGKYSVSSKAFFYAMIFIVKKIVYHEKK